MVGSQGEKGLLPNVVVGLGNEGLLYFRRTLFANPTTSRGVRFGLTSWERGGYGDGVDNGSQ